MIKKNTKMIFEGEKDQNTDEFIGGIPLTKGEIVNIHKEDQVLQYEVLDKTIDCFLDGDDQTINITYKLRRK